MNTASREWLAWHALLCIAVQVADSNFSVSFSVGRSDLAHREPTRNKRRQKHRQRATHLLKKSWDRNYKQNPASSQKPI